MDRHGEVERKFDIEPGAVLPDLAGFAVVGDAVELQLDAMYFDTADARLARHHITLRRRTGGDDAGWHLKLPAGQDERTEVRRPLGRATGTVPVALVRASDARRAYATALRRASSRSTPLDPVSSIMPHRELGAQGRMATCSEPWQHDGLTAN